MELIHNSFSSSTEYSYAEQGFLPNSLDSALNGSVVPYDNAFGFISVDIPNQYGVLLPFIVYSAVESTPQADCLLNTNPSQTESFVLSTLKDKIQLNPDSTEIANSFVVGNASHAAHIFDSLNISNVSVHLTTDKSIMFELSFKDAYFSLEFFEDGDIVYLSRLGQAKSSAYDITNDEVYDRICEIYELTLSKHA